MGGRTRFFRPTVVPTLADRLDEYEASGHSFESAEERSIYDARVKEEIKWKQSYRPPQRVPATLQTPLDGSTTIEIPPAGQGSMGNATYEALPPREDSLLPLGPVGRPRASLLDTSALPPVPSFRPSQIQTSTPLHLAATSPSSSTPSISQASATDTLKAASKTARAALSPFPGNANATPGPSRLPVRSSTLPPTPRVADTPPPSIASPIDTPVASNSGVIGEGRARRDPPDTPLPLPSLSALAGGKKGKAKKELQTLTKRWEDFNKGLAKDEKGKEKEGDVPVAVPARKGKGRNRTVSRTMVPELGAGVLKGLRLCLPVMPGQEGHQADRWKIIAKMGGEVLLQPDTAVTHVIFDGPGPPAKLARLLDLPSLASLPEGTVCVKWNWLSSCKTSGKLLDCSPWLSFPRSNSKFLPPIMPLKTASTRLGDITDRMMGKTVSITRKRSASGSDSETASPKKPKPLPSRLASYVPAASKPPPRPAPAPAQARSDPSDNATKHSLSDGPGWINPAPKDRDPLDDFINGVKDGTIKDDEPANETSPEANGDGDDSNPNPLADKYKCGQSNDGGGGKGPNEWLAKKFDEMHELYSGVQGKNDFAIRGYLMAAAALRRTSTPITSGKSARALKGIGDSLANRIDEILEDRPGRMFYEDNEQTRAVATFKDIYGVGRTLANTLWQKGASSIADLKANPAKYGLTSYHHQIGLQLYDDLLVRIPRAECKQIFEIVLATAKALDPKVECEIMGSYRRGSETSGDVDILITRDPSDGKTHSGVLQGLVETLFASGVITHELSRPGVWDALEAKWMGVCRIGPSGVHRRIDILCIPYDQWGGALIYFTGNDIFNRSLRLYARHQGYSLNQRGLSKGVIRGKDGLKLTEGTIIASRTEQEIFDVLGLRWR